MTYNELKEIVDERIKTRPESLPVDAFYIASQLNIRLKNSIEAKEDFGNENPFKSCNAIYTLNKGEYIIYFNEHYAYKNFSIAHEIAHHLLGHTSEGVEQHHDAQLMADIIVAPIDLIHKYKIKSATELSEICKIPIEAAKAYWHEITQRKERFHFFYKNKYTKIGSIIGLLLVTTILMFYCYYAKNNTTVVYIESPETLTHSTNTPSVKPSDTPTEETYFQTVYVTPSGKKYHRANCRHIKNTETIIDFSIEGAKKAGYDPCKDCIGE